MANHRRLTPKQEEAVITDRFRHKMTVREIAEKWEVHQQTVYNIFRRHGGNPVPGKARGAE